jgi:hypothetical protein
MTPRSRLIYPFYPTDPIHATDPTHPTNLT